MTNLSMSLLFLALSILRSCRLKGTCSIVSGTFPARSCGTVKFSSEQIVRHLVLRVDPARHGVCSGQTAQHCLHLQTHTTKYRRVRGQKKFKASVKCWQLVIISSISYQYFTLTLNFSCTRTLEKSRSVEHSTGLVSGSPSSSPARRLLNRSTQCSPSHGNPHFALFPILSSDIGVKQTTHVYQTEPE